VVSHLRWTFTTEQLIERSMNDLRAAYALRLLPAYLLSANAALPTQPSLAAPPTLQLVA